MNPAQGQALLRSKVVVMLALLMVLLSVGVVTVLAQGSSDESGYVNIRIKCLEIRSLPADLLDGDIAELDLMIFISDGDRVKGKFIFEHDSPEAGSRPVRVGDRLCAEIDSVGPYFLVDGAKDEVAVWFLAVDTDDLNQLLSTVTDGAVSVLGDAFQELLKMTEIISVFKANLLSLVLELALGRAVDAWEKPDTIGEYQTILWRQQNWGQGSYSVVSADGGIALEYEIALTYEEPAQNQQDSRSSPSRLHWNDFLSQTSGITDPYDLIRWLDNRPEKVDHPQGGYTLSTGQDEAIILWTGLYVDDTTLGGSVIPYLVDGRTGVWIVLPNSIVTVPTPGGTIGIDGYQSGGTANNVPVFITRVDVPANSESGASFTCPNTGNYSLVLESGAYSPWASGVGGQWRTFVYAYVNHEVVWEKNQYGFVAPAPYGTPGRDVAAIGRMESRVDDTKSGAEALGVGDSDTVFCEAGQLIRFVTMDERGAYADNSGSVSVGIYSLSS